MTTQARSWQLDPQSLFKHLFTVGLAYFQKETEPGSAGLFSARFGTAPYLAIADGVEELVWPDTTPNSEETAPGGYRPLLTD